MERKETTRKAAEKYYDSIAPPYGTMVSLGGFEAVYALLNDYGSSELYIPTVKKVFGKCLEKALIEEYKSTGAHFRKLALKYGFSDRYAQKLIKRLNDYRLKPVDLRTAESRIIKAKAF